MTKTGLNINLEILLGFILMIILALAAQSYRHDLKGFTADTESESSISRNESSPEIGN